MHDRDIVAAVVAGDPAGLAAAYDSYATALYSYCRSMLAEPADAADAVQDTFVIAAAKLAGLREPDRLRPWLYAVARNECHRRLRARARFSSLDEAGDVTDPTEAEPRGAEQAVLRELVAAAVAGLNPGDREVIELTLRHELTGGDLAAALGVGANQAHALASRARTQLERSLGALLVARAGRRSCAELDALLAGWDGTLTILMRKRISRHVDQCETCGARKRRELSPAMLLSALPLAAVPLPRLPLSLRQQVLRLVSDTSQDAASYRDLVVRRAGRFASGGFPRQVSPVGRSPRPRHLSAAAMFTSAAALLVLAGGGTAAYLMSRQHHVQSEASVTVTVTVTPSSSRTSAPKTSAPATPAATPSPSASPSPSPSASPSPGRLNVSAAYVKLSQPALGGPYSGVFTITAVGGPVRYVISVPASEQSYLAVDPLAGLLTAGQQQVLTATVTASPGGPQPPFSNPVTVNPGGVMVILEYPPSG